MKPFNLCSIRITIQSYTGAIEVKYDKPRSEAATSPDLVNIITKFIVEYFEPPTANKPVCTKTDNQDYCFCLKKEYVSSPEYSLVIKPKLKKYRWCKFPEAVGYGIRVYKDGKPLGFTYSPI